MAKAAGWSNVRYEGLAMGTGRDRVGCKADAGVTRTLPNQPFVPFWLCPGLMRLPFVPFWLIPGRTF